VIFSPVVSWPTHGGLHADEGSGAAKAGDAARLSLRNRDRDNATAAEIQGLPYFDEQKKTRLRSHLSA
jgi:hypothetical protein